MICALERVLDVHTHIRMHHGKRGPRECDSSGRGDIDKGGPVDPTRSVVWKGDDGLPLSQQGINILGIPMGQPEYVRQFLEEKADEHRPMVEDPQAAWLLLLMCASTRANFWLRGGSNPNGLRLSLKPTMHVGMPQTDSELSRRRISTSHCFVTVLPKGFRAHQRRQDQRGSTLGQLSTLFENGARDTQEWLTPFRGLWKVRCFEAVRRCAQSLSDAGFESPTWTERA